MNTVNNEVDLSLSDLGAIERFIGTPPSLNVNEFYFWADTKLDELVAEGSTLAGDIVWAIIREALPTLVKPSERPRHLRNNH